MANPPSMNTSRNRFSKRVAGALAVCIGVLVMSTGSSNAGLPSVCTAQPQLIFTAPREAHAFGPGETVEVAGEACDDLLLNHIRLDYWRANQLVLRAESAVECPGCGIANASSWSHSPDLPPGYYVVKANAFSTTGEQSIVAQRSFVTGLQAAPNVLPPIPQPPSGVELPAPPAIGSPGAGKTVPAADRPVPASGRAPAGSEVTIYEVRGTGGEPIATVQANNRGRWSTSLHLPSGKHTIVAQAEDDEGILSPLSKRVTFGVDADRPVIDVLTEEGTTFLPLEPVTIEGHFLDNRKIGYLIVEYWLLNQLVLQDRVVCPACDQQDMVWQHTPELPEPGYYYVRVRGFDASGNGAWTQTTTFVKTI